jgi:hypothetical protein
LYPCRLLSAWSFQSKLGIISNTIILAAPQLAHLLFVIFNAITLFALLSYLGLGQRVSYASSYAASFEETFRALLGLGYYVKFTGNLHRVLVHGKPPQGPGSDRKPLQGSNSQETSTDSWFTGNLHRVLATGTIQQYLLQHPLVLVHSSGWSPASC